jgi:hypothetical protein
MYRAAPTVTIEEKKNCLQTWEKSNPWVHQIFAFCLKKLRFMMQKNHPQIQGDESISPVSTRDL